MRPCGRAAVTSVVAIRDQRTAYPCHRAACARSPAAYGLHAALVPANEVRVVPRIRLLQVCAVFNDAWRDVECNQSHKLVAPNRGRRPIWVRVQMNESTTPFLVDADSFYSVSQRDLDHA